MLAIGDDNPRRKAPVITLLLIAANVFVYAFVQPHEPGAAQDFVFRWGFDPEQPWSARVLTSMFMHGGLFHLLSNMWVLWLVGDNVEEKFGRFRYLFLYLLAGAAAAWTFGWLSVREGPNAEFLEKYGIPYVPAVGASGAIYGAMGMYVVLFPWARFRTLFWFTVIPIPAFVYLGLLIAIDVWHTVSTMGPSAGGVAKAAHAGGAVFGILAALVLKRAVGGGGEGDAWDVAVGFASTKRRDGPSAPRARRADDLATPGGLGREIAADDDPDLPPDPETEQRRARGALAAQIGELARSGRARQAIDLYEAWLAAGATPPLDPEVVIGVAHEFYNQGLPKKAIEAYARYLEADRNGPHAPEAALRLGVLYAKVRNDTEAAIEWFEEAAETHGDPRMREYAKSELRRLGAR
ncbi:MAG: hypothetical protein HMLKMBBP_02674 [Planctomycetes bacterium]|nr:hypothetical protein [Planctomycetota bacterium]